MRKHPELLVAECTESQLRQYTDAAAAYRHYLDALATRDLDLLFDTRQRLSFVTTMARRHESLIGVLCNEEDFWAVQVDSGNRLVSSRPFRQLVVDTRGRMALMHTIHPLDFAAVKERLGVSPSREAIKAPKDLLQASVARHLWDAYLRHTHGPARGAEQAADRRDASPASG